MIPDFIEAESKGAHALRDRPSEDFIAAMRQRYPTEQEYNQLLTRKMRSRRESPGYRNYRLEELTAALHRLLEDRLDVDFEVSDTRWLTGGASKIQVGFTLHRDEPGGSTETPLVIRMEPPESLNCTSRQREHEVMRELDGVIPVPKTYWVDPHGSWFPEPALIYEFVPGVTKPSKQESGISGVGTRFGPELSRRLGEEFVGQLATLHAHAYSTQQLPSFDEPAVGTAETTQWQMNRVRRIWEEDRGQDFPMVEAAANWLERNQPDLDHVSLIHGDYRTGNFLFDEDRATILAWLDWERTHLGDRHRDLAWTTHKLFGSVAEDGETFLVGGLIPEVEFYERYEEVSGLPILQEVLDYYRVFNGYQLTVSTLGTAYRVSRLGRSHQDVLLAHVEGVSYVFAQHLADALDGHI